MLEICLHGSLARAFQSNGSFLKQAAKMCGDSYDGCGPLAERLDSTPQELLPERLLDASRRYSSVATTGKAVGCFRKILIRSKNQKGCWMLQEDTPQ